MKNIIVGNIEQPARASHIDILGRRYKSWWVINFLIFGPFVVWLLWAFFGVRFVMWVVDAKIGATDSNLLPSLGQTGDLFGGVNALFAAYAFAGVAVAAYFQHKTFVVVEQQQKQAGFEPLFFQLITLNRSLLPNVLGEFDMSFGNWVAGLLIGLNKQEWVHELSEETPPAAIVDKSTHFYYTSYKDAEDDLGPYFRSLYHVFKLIDDSGLSKEKRIEYADIARAMLSRDELSLMVVNCSSAHGDDFRRLIAKYGILKHLSRSRKEDKATLRLAQHSFGPTALMDAKGREGFWRQVPASRPPGM
jgi:hypothetical protein